MHFLAFYHRNRRKSCQNLDKILLIGHHLIDVLVGAGGLIKMILRSDAVDDAFAVEHIDLLLKREGLDSLCAAHQSAGSVRRAHERLRTSESLYYIRACALRSRYDADLSLPGTDGTLAVNDDVIAVVVLQAA